MFKGKKVLAIIPARSGSKRIPGKNIKLLMGKPLVAHTIEESLRSEFIDRTVVSTDDENIAKVAREYGGYVPFIRPDELAQDDSSALAVVLHALDFLEKKEGFLSDIVVYLPPTSPFRTAEQIDDAISKIDEADGVVGVTEVSQHPYFVFSSENGYLRPLLDVKNRPLSWQELPKYYMTNTSIFVAKRGYYDKYNIKTISKTDTVIPTFEGKLRA